MFLKSYCHLCGERFDTSTEMLCEPCLSDLSESRLSDQCCCICASSNGTSSSDNGICGQCQKNPPFFDYSLIPFEYLFPLNSLIKGLKYNNNFFYSRLLSRLFISYVSAHEVQMPDCIIPVPLHPFRLMQRGYNQSELLAKEISNALHCPVDTSFCKRIRPTDQQAYKDKKQRTRNIKDAFSVKTPLPYKHIAILDDVVTTGSTANEVSRVFKQAGVEFIQIWACAKVNLEATGYSN